MLPLRALGVLLIGVCVLGFLTVADDLRHVGELIGVSWIGVAGLGMLACSYRRPRPR